jgi:hypothetical protein
MPVLVNQGEHPILAAWLFYTPRSSLEGFRDRVRQGGLRFGVIDVDPGEGKPRDQVDVHLVASTQDAPLPEGGDAGAADDRTDEATSGAEEVPEGDRASDEQGQDDDEGGPAGDAEANERAVAAQRAMREAARRMLEDEELERIDFGSTTREAARRYLQPHEVGDVYWLVSLPGLPELADFVDQLLDSSPDMRWAVWHIDQQGVLRMAPAREVKPMAGNILRVKL